MNSTHLLEIEDEVKQMLVRLRGAATFSSLRHDGGQLVGKWGIQPISDSLLSIG